MVNHSDHRHQHIATLGQSALFRGLPETALDRMLPHFQQETCHKGLRLDRGMTEKRFFLILEGRMEVNRCNPESGKRLALFLLDPGDGFDIITLLDGRPQDTESVALDDMRLLSALVALVRQWISEFPQFNQRFLPYLGSQFRGMEALKHQAGALLHRIECRSRTPGEHPK